MAVAADGTFFPVCVDNRTGVRQVWTAPVEVRGKVARNGSSELANLVDVSDKASIRTAESAFDYSTSELTTVLRVQNSSEDTLRGPILLRLVSLEGQAGAVTIRRAANGVDGVGAVWDFSSLLPGNGELAPGEESEGLRATFVVTNPQPFGPNGERTGLLAKPLFRVLVGGFTSSARYLQQLNRAR